MIGLRVFLTWRFLREIIFRFGVNILFIVGGFTVVLLMVLVEMLTGEH